MQVLNFVQIARPTAVQKKWSLFKDVLREIDLQLLPRQESLVIRLTHGNPLLINTTEGKTIV